MAAAGDAGRTHDSVANATHDLYRQYGKQIYAYCLHQLRSREEAEDAVQTTFLNAFRGLQRGTTTKFEQAWLYKIAQNVCIARRSSSGRRLRLEAPDDFEILDEIVPSARGSAETLELMGLEDALERMPENQRRVILLREWQGLSYREIATELDLSQGAVEMLIFRARKTLALALEEPEAAKRRPGKAQTGFSFGSLVAAMKGLFSTGAALKMAAVAVTAVTVGTNAVHSVVHRMTTPKHTRAAVAPQIRQASTTSVVPKAPVQLVSWKAPRMKVVTAGGGGAASAASTVPAGSGPRPVIASDVSAPAPPPPPAADEPAAPGSPSAGGGVVSIIASAAPVATHAAGETASSSPPPPPPPAPGGSGTSEGSGGEGSGSSGGGDQQHGQGGGERGGSSATTSGTGGTGGTGGNDNGGRGAGHKDRGGGNHPSTYGTTTDPTTTPTTTTTDPTTTTTTKTTDQTTTDTTTATTTTTDTTTTPTTITPTTTMSDSSTSTDTTSGTTTTTTTQTTTTQTTGDGGSSDGGSSSSGGSRGHGGGNDGGGGNGGGGGGSDHHHGGGG